MNDSLPEEPSIKAEHTDPQYPGTVSSLPGPTRPPLRRSGIAWQTGEFTPDAEPKRWAHYLRLDSLAAGPLHWREPVAGWLRRHQAWLDLTDPDQQRSYTTNAETVVAVLRGGRVLAADDLGDAPGVGLAGIVADGEEPGEELLVEVADELRAELVGELPPLRSDVWKTELRARYAATVHKASKSSLRGLIEKVLNAPKDEQDRVLGWATRKLVAQEWAGYLTRDQVRGYVEDLLDATSWAGRNSKPTPYTVYLEIAIAEQRAEEDALRDVYGITEEAS